MFDAQVAAVTAVAILVLASLTMLLLPRMRRFAIYVVTPSNSAVPCHSTERAASRLLTPDAKRELKRRSIPMTMWLAAFALPFTACVNVVIKVCGPRLRIAWLQEGGARGCQTPLYAPPTHPHRSTSLA